MVNYGHQGIILDLKSVHIPWYPQVTILNVGESPSNISNRHWWILVGWLVGELGIVVNITWYNYGIIMAGWWLYTHPSEKYDFVNWDDDRNPIYGKIKLMFQTTNQNMSNASTSFITLFVLWLDHCIPGLFSSARCILSWIPRLPRPDGVFNFFRKRMTGRQKMGRFIVIRAMEKYPAW